MTCTGSASRVAGAWTGGHLYRALPQSRAARHSSVVGQTQPSQRGQLLLVRRRKALLPFEDGERIGAADAHTASRLNRNPMKFRNLQQADANLCRHNRAPKLPASADITRAPVATHRVVPGEPSQLPPPDAVPPSAAAALQLSNPAVVPGEPVSGQGYGCPPESPVALSVGGTPAGETVADSNGAFQSTFHMQTVTEGRYQVTADCGPVLLAAPLDVVLVSNVNAATSPLTVIVFFLLIGVFVYMRRLLNPPARKVVGK